MNALDPDLVAMARRLDGNLRNGGDGAGEPVGRQARGLDRTFDVVRANIFDIAGIRITCSFISDIYVLSGMLTEQRDVETPQIKDFEYARDVPAHVLAELKQAADVASELDRKMESLRSEVNAL